MHELTPDLLAEITTKLLSGAQQATAQQPSFPGSPSPNTVPVSSRLPPNNELSRVVPAWSHQPTVDPSVAGSQLPATFAHPPVDGYATPAGFISNGFFPNDGYAPPNAYAPPPGSAPHGGDAPHLTSGHIHPAGDTPSGYGTPIGDVAPSAYSAPSGNMPLHAAAHPGSVSSASPGNEASGLLRFVNQIRNPGPAWESGFCPGPNGPLGHRPFAQAPFPAAISGVRPWDVASIRQDFPILRQVVHGKPLVWFDNAATTQKPQAVIDAISHYYSNDNSNIHRGAHSLAARSTDAFENVRTKVAQFLGAGSSREIIFVRGTTEAINLVTQTYGRKFLQPGDEIILSTLEHHANIVPWQMVAKERGATLRVIPVNDRGEIKLQDYQALLGPRTRVVALTQASNSLGTVLPVAEMSKMAKRFGAHVLIDGAQSVSHMPVNVQELGCDFFVFSGHKIFGPTGIGVVYVREELQEIMPPWQGGGNMIRNVTFDETSYSEPPGKFEAGTPNIADTVGLGAALDYVQQLGLTNIGTYEHELLGYATEGLRSIDGLRIIGQAAKKVSLISFVLKDRKTEEVGKLLDLEGIAVRAGHHCSQPSLRRFGVEATVRPSFAFYNTKSEVDHLVESIRRISGHSVRTWSTPQTARTPTFRST